MRLIISCLTCSIFFGSCGHESHLSEPLFTDSLILEAAGLRIDFNSLGLFDTNYYYIRGECIGSDEGHRFSAKTYEGNIDWHSGSGRGEVDSILALVIKLNPIEEIYETPMTYFSTQYDWKKLSRIATKRNSKPQLLAVEKIREYYFGYAYFIDSISNDPQRPEQIRTELNCFVPIDTISLEFRFDCIATDCSGMVSKFIKIIRSIRIKKLLVTKAKM